MVVLFWLDLWEIFFFAKLWFESWDLFIASPALYHCTMVTSGFHLWQFEVFNFGAKGLVVVLFSLDLWEIFFLITTVVWTWDLWIASPALYHCTMVTSGFHLWLFQVFNSGAKGLVVVLFWLDLWEIFFLDTPVVWTWDLWISSPALYHCATVTSGFHLSQYQVFNYGCRGIGGGIVLIGHVRDFLFWSHWGLNLDLQISSPALYHCTTVTSGFHLCQFQVFKSGAEGLVVVLFILDLWEIFFFATSGFEPGASGSLVLHSTTARWWLLVFTCWQFQVFNSGAEGLVVVFFWLYLWRDFLFVYTGVWT